MERMHELVTAINATGTTLILMLFAIFLGIWLNRRDVNQLRADTKGEIAQLRADMNLGRADTKGEIAQLRADMNLGFARVDSRFNAMDARIDRIHEDFGVFHHTLGQHDARLDALEKE